MNSSNQDQHLSAGDSRKQAMLDRMSELYDRTIAAAKKAEPGTVFNSLHAVVVDEGPALLAELTESVTRDVSADHQPDTLDCPACKKKRNG